MKISEVISDKIKNNHALDAYVKGAAAKITAHVSSNSMPFFPEYTDHNISHFEAVLETAVDLATEKSVDHMTDVDFVVLTTAVMLHDLGMHLTKDGFTTLISPNGPMCPIEGFDDPPWHELWISFISEAKRFDARKLESLFGPNYKPVVGFPTKDEAWNEFDMLLVGEFLRRHHPRLAHEIALQGMPAKNGNTIRFCSVESEQEYFLSDISGIVARSHGMNLRDTFPYLLMKYRNRVEIRSTHPVYLMTLLRIADYLQIQSSRAPHARTEVSKLRSPVSSREWSVHQCIADITNIADPESIDITAHPRDVDTYLRLKDWIFGLQRELDTSWAVLGEIYGLQAHSGLNKIGLRIRRIRSNIDDFNAFSKSVDYIPKRISFSTSDSELLKLLIGPLYSNEIYVGLRELIQNASDAVKELDGLVKQGVVTAKPPRVDMSSDIRVDFLLAEKTRKSEEYLVREIVISDRGVGMTADIIQNYFLKAGASFRNSNFWKKNFESADGSIRVQRSGRFGVGALAVFLLGEKIYVETKHYLSGPSDGLFFTAGVEDVSINIVKIDCEYGTKIRIVIPDYLQKKVGSLLPAFYGQKEVGIRHGLGQYFGTNPSLNYYVNNDLIPWNRKEMLPEERCSSDVMWNYFETEGFEVHWIYGGNYIDLAVNKIRVGDGSRNRSWPSGAANVGIKFQSSIFKVPSLSVGDNVGAFPLNLQRNSYSGSELIFAKELLLDITDEFVFTCLWQLLGQEKFAFPEYAGLESTGYPHYYYPDTRWLHCSDGIILHNVHFLNEYNPEFALLRFGGDYINSRDDIISKLPEKSLYFYGGNDEFSTRSFKMKGSLLSLLGRGRSFGFLKDRSVSHSVYVPQSFVETIRRKMKPGIEARRLLDQLEEDCLAGWSVHSKSDFTEPDGVNAVRKKFSPDSEFASVFSIHKMSGCGGQKNESNDIFVLTRWMELLGQPYLPTSVEKVAKLQDALRYKLGDKYEIFERRAKARQKDFDGIECEES